MDIKLLVIELLKVNSRQQSMSRDIAGGRGSNIYRVTSPAIHNNKDFTKTRPTDVSQWKESISPLLPIAFCLLYRGYHHSCLHSTSTASWNALSWFQCHQSFSSMSAPLALAKKPRWGWDRACHGESKPNKVYHNDILLVWIWGHTRHKLNQNLVTSSFATYHSISKKGK